VKKNVFRFLTLSVGILFIMSCTAHGANLPKNSTQVVPVNQSLFAEEFNSLDSSIWSALPSLTPFAGLEGSKTPGEVKVEDGLLKLSRYAPEIAGENPASYIQTKQAVNLPGTFSATMRFRNEFTAFGFGNLFVEMYNHKIAIGHSGLDRTIDNTYDYSYNDNNFYILSLHVTSQGYTIKIKEDTANAPEQTFSQNTDLSEYMGNSNLTVWGGSNTQSAQYSEIDYIRITN
jgi:hypothetical protein